MEFDRRRELEQALTLALQSEKLPALSITPNRQLQHFIVQTDVRFLHENKKNILKWNWLPWINPVY